MLLWGYADDVQAETDDSYIRLEDVPFFKLDEDDPRLVEYRELKSLGKLPKTSKPPVFTVIEGPKN